MGQCPGEESRRKPVMGPVVDIPPPQEPMEKLPDFGGRIFEGVPERAWLEGG